MILFVATLVGFLTHPAFAEPSKNTYNLENSYKLQSCIGPTRPDEWGSYFIGPADEEDRCKFDTSKHCWENQQFAVFPQGSGVASMVAVRASSSQTICEEMGRSDCDLVTISITKDPKSSSDFFTYERSTIRADKVIFSESKNVPIEFVLNNEGRFILPYDSCNFFEAKYKVLPIK